MDNITPNKKEMKVKEIIELMSFISSSELNEVKIETDEIKLSVRKSVEVETRFVEHYAQTPVAQAPVSVAAPVTATSPSAPSTPASVPVASASEDNLITIKSPMIGTFYRSSSPESPSFVEVGSKISSGSPVCIIEAMKLFNEIESEVSGTIVKILVDNSSPVEYDQPLFLVNPA